MVVGAVKCATSQDAVAEATLIGAATGATSQVVATVATLTGTILEEATTSAMSRATPKAAATGATVDAEKTWANIGAVETERGRPEEEKTTGTTSATSCSSWPTAFVGPAATGAK